MKALLRIFKNRRDVGTMLRSLWDFLKERRGGKWLFTRIIGFLAPYTGSIGALVVDVRPGYALIQMKDRRGVRNHLKSVHAMALINLSEFATGLAIIFAMPPGTRGILKEIAIKYPKKARGTLHCECEFDFVPTAEKREYEVVGRIYSDFYGPEKELVAQATARWLIGPEQA